MPEVKICDVSLRDGMQILNRHAVIPLEKRLQLVEALQRARLPYLEVGSFVSPRVIAAMRDTPELLRRMPAYDGEVAVLIPKIRYYRELKDLPRVTTVALFVSASEGYSQANTRMSVDQAVDAAGEVAAAAGADGYRVRGYLSCAFRDTEDGAEIPAERSFEICERLWAMGCETVALSDTDGRGTPRDIERVLSHFADRSRLDGAGVHLHDRNGLGITNSLVAYRNGVRVFDCSVGGIGGSKAVASSVGNVATEELVHLFEGMGVDTGIDLAALLEAGRIVLDMTHFVGDPPPPSRLLFDRITRREGLVEFLSFSDPRQAEAAAPQAAEPHWGEDLLFRPSGRAWAALAATAAVVTAAVAAGLGTAAAVLGLSPHQSGWLGLILGLVAFGGCFAAAARGSLAALQHGAAVLRLDDDEARFLTDLVAGLRVSLLEADGGTAGGAPR